jgi:hypothetical protein
MGYCCRCGVYAALDDDKTCTACRLGWRPAGPVPADLGTRRQPLGQPLTPGDGQMYGVPVFCAVRLACAPAFSYRPALVKLAVQMRKPAVDLDAVETVALEGCELTAAFRAGIPLELALLRDMRLELPHAREPAVAACAAEGVVLAALDAHRDVDRHAQHIPGFPARAELLSHVHHIPGGSSYADPPLGDPL